jgi:hypothetical protein
MKTKITLIVTLVVSHVAVFLAGVIIERKLAFSYFVRETNAAAASVSFGHYINYRNIAVDVKAAKYDNALCQAQLTASSFLDELRACAADATCKVSLQKEARQLAPEVFGGAPVPFTYIESKNGIRRCDG